LKLVRISATTSENLMLGGVSVVILSTGSRDRIKFLEHLLRSLANQNFKGFETVLVVEEMSEELERLISRFDSIMPRVFVTGHWNKCKSMNKAVRRVESPILILLEDDLILEPNFVEEILKPFSDERVGCVYSRCIWVFSESIKRSKSFAGYIARAVSKLSAHEHLSRMVRRVGKHLYEVTVFTMSVACRRDVLIKAGLWDESVEEPIQGEDYDIALRIVKLGYKIIQNTRAVSYHFTRQTTKRYIKLKRDPRYIMGLNHSDVYFIAKNADLLGLAKALSHFLYRVIEGIFWAAKVRDVRASLYGVAGALLGLARGLSRCLYQ